MRRHRTEKEIRQKREQIALQFRQELVRFDGLSIVGSLPNSRYIVRDGGREYQAVVLPDSFAYYEYRLNVGSHKQKYRTEMLIVGRHNAVVPITVVSLEQVMVFEPLAVPELPDALSKYAEEKANLLLSKYLLNFESAYEELTRMSPKTRQRYNRKREAYLKPKVGRPWAS